jgi:hypothetical protein
MRIYSRHTRRTTRYYLRVLRNIQAIDYWTIAMALSTTLAVIAMGAR